MLKKKKRLTYKEKRDKLDFLLKNGELISKDIKDISLIGRGSRYMVYKFKYNDEYDTVSIPLYSYIDD